MHKASLLICLLLPTWIIGQNKEMDIDTQINAVTVYEQSAQVEREGKKELPSGDWTLVFDDLPHNLNQSQIRFTGSGEFVIQSIFYTRKQDTMNLAAIRAYKPPSNPTPLIQALQDESTDLAGRIAVYEREKALLNENSNFKSSTDGVDLDRLMKASDFLRNRHLELHSTLRELRGRQLEIQEEINQLQLIRSQAPSPQIEHYLQLNVRVTAQKKSSCTFRVSYLVNSAGWSPAYDARVNDISAPVELEYRAKVFQKSGEKWDKVALTLSTGKPSESRAQPSLNPWRLGAVAPPPPPVNRSVVNTPISTANAYLQSRGYNANVKEIKGQVLDSNGEALPFVKVVFVGTNQGTTSDIDGRYIAAVPQGAQQVEFSYLGFRTLRLNVSQPTLSVYLDEAPVALRSVVVDRDQGGRRDMTVKSMEIQSINAIPMLAEATVASTSIFKRGRRDKSVYDNTYADVRASYSPTNIKFTADTPYTIPSDGKEYSVTLLEYDVPAEYVYSCSPKLSSDVFLTARITDWEELDLLPGPAQIYFEGSYVGSSVIDPSFADDTLNLSLGTDAAIRIERIRSKSGQKRQILGSTRTDSREWTLSIRNAKRNPIEMIIEDQIPVSQVDEVEVKLAQDGGARLDEETGILTWNLKLKPSESKTLTFRYEVQRPKDSYISLE